MSEAMPMPKQSDEHRWLEQLVGSWTYEGGGSPEQECQTTGTQTVRMLGDVWMIAEADGTVGGGHASQHIITLGFDPEKGRFVGSFIASMMSSFWLYDGALDPDGRSLRLGCVGPRFDGKPGLADYEDVVEIVSKDEYFLRGRVKQDDGTWHEFMTTRYRRTA